MPGARARGFHLSATNVGLLGGSFDPIHHGHLIAGLVAVEQLGLDQLRFVPTGEQPFKRGRHVATAGQRSEMVALAIQGVSSFALERAEVDRPGPSYTVDTLRALRDREPHAAFTLLLGADAALELPSWHEAQAITGLARVVAFARAGGSRPAGPHIAQVIEVPAIGISATELRGRVAAGRAIRYWVPDAVAEYIAAHRLYLGPE